MISIAFVVVSTIGMTLNTIPSIQHRNIDNEPIDNPKLALIEAICISWFTIEYLLRFAGTKIIPEATGQVFSKRIEITPQIHIRKFEEQVA